MLEEVFRGNRIAIINWQRAYTPRNDSRHISTSTEYVLVYAKDLDRAKTALLPRDEVVSGAEMPDGDVRPWTDSPATGSNAKNHKSMVYAIQSPFTGELLYPPAGSAWRLGQNLNLRGLRDWGCAYKAVEIDDAARRAAVIGIPERSGLSDTRRRPRGVPKAGRDVRLRLHRHWFHSGHFSDGFHDSLLIRSQVGDSIDISTAPPKTRSDARRKISG